MRGLAPGRVALEDGTKSEGGGILLVMMLWQCCCGGGGRGGGEVEVGVAGVELVEEHCLDDEAEGEVGVLDEVEEEVVGELAALYGAAQSALLLFCQILSVLLLFGIRRMKKIKIKKKIILQNL